MQDPNHQPEEQVPPEVLVLLLARTESEAAHFQGEAETVRKRGLCCPDHQTDTSLDGFRSDEDLKVKMALHTSESLYEIVYDRVRQ